MNRWCAVILLASFSLLASAQSAKSFIKAGEQLLANGLIEAAIEEYDKALVADPQSGKAYFMRAQAYLILKDTIQAAQDFQKAAVFNELSEENFLTSAQLFYAAGDNDKALENAERSINEKDKNHEAWLLRAKIFYAQEKQAEASFAINAALDVRQSPKAHYLAGLIASELGQDLDAEQFFEKAIMKDERNVEVYLALARQQLKMNKNDYAIENCSYVLLLLDPDNIQAATLRSQAFYAESNLDQAIKDISLAIRIERNNTSLYLMRASYYDEYGLHTNAIDDYGFVLASNPENIEALERRAKLYEKVGNKQAAAADYKSLLAILGEDDAEIAKKVFELNRETERPDIQVLLPKRSSNDELQLKQTDQSMVVEGVLGDMSGIKSLKINNEVVEVQAIGAGKYQFKWSLGAEALDFVTITAIDVYENTSTVSYAVEKIEVQKPSIALISPLLNDNGTISIAEGDRYLYLEGIVDDQSQIVQITVDEVNASFVPNDYNPRFTATVDVSNRSNIVIKAIDIYGNQMEQSYEFSRDGMMMADQNPMGKTWVVLIENSEYREFANLNAPSQDIKLLQEALSRYKISNIIHKKNMSKHEMERFFSIDLRDLVRSNQVNSLMIWYAGHGKNIHNVGYWVPVDGQSNDEFSFFNVNALKASLYTYTSLQHVLVISDACEAGPGFQVAMRGGRQIKDCADQTLTTKKSFLSLTSAGEQSAYDNSLFAKSFANALLNSPEDCIPIDAVSQRVISVMTTNTLQKPRFGKIAGLEDENGTFFFIAK